MKQRWTLNKSEVNLLKMVFSDGKRKKATKVSRNYVESKTTLFLEHLPTAEKVEGTIPIGHYTRDEMKLITYKLYQKLFLELEKKVAKKLKIAGL